VPSPQDLQFPDDAFRHVQPAPLATRPFRVPPVQTFTLDGGIEVYLVEQHVLPIVQMQLELDGGSLVDPPDRIGLASIAMSMLVEGTERLDKIAYAEALADVASSITTSAGDDSLTLSLASLTEHLDRTVALFVDTLRTPGFRPSDFTRLIKRRIEGVRQSRASPQSIPSRVMGRILYGSDHPHGSVTTEASLAAIAIDDCRALATRWLRPEGARLFVVGDVDEARVRALFGSGQLGSGRAPAMPSLPSPAQLPGHHFFVHAPGATQAQVSYMQHGPRRDDPGYLANALLAAIVGGGFASRLNMNLRESRGLSYGVRGGFSYSRSDGIFTAGGPVQGSAAAEAVAQIELEIRDLASGARPATADELDREKQGAVLALPGRFATAQAALGQYRGLVYYGLPLDYYDDYVARVSAVTLDDIAHAAKAELRLDDGCVLVVGDAPVGGGDVTTLDVDGVCLPRP
jgi:predicted Zn-dependent peptidase